MITFRIKGNPIAKQSARFGFNDKEIRSYQPAKIVQTKKSIQYQLQSQLPKGFKMFTKYVQIIECGFIFPYLKGHTKKQIAEMETGIKTNFKTTIPDLDNLQKMLFDAMQGIVFKNDSLIVMMDNVYKIYHKEPEIIIRLKGK